MTPHDRDQDQERRRSDAVARSEVMDGLTAARRREEARPRPSPAAQEEMLRTGFPRLPGGAAAAVREATPGELRRLRASLRDAADDRAAEGVANLRQQLTEYHSLLDRLGSASARHAALEEECERRGSRIRSLEAEVAALRMERAQRGALRVGCVGIEGHVAGGFVPMSQIRMQQQRQQQQQLQQQQLRLHQQLQQLQLQQQHQQQQQQQMQDLPNPAMVQSQPEVSSFANQYQAPHSVCNTSNPIMTSVHFPQSQCLQARQGISPSPLSNYQFPSEGGFHSGCCVPSSGWTVFDRAGGLSQAPPGRPISGDCATAMGTTMRPGAKRLRSDDVASPPDGARTFEGDAFPSPEHAAYMPEAA